MLTLTPRILTLTPVFAFIALGAAAADRQVKTATADSGAEVLIYGHKNWDKGCRSMPTPVIKVTRPPANGTVAVRPGSFVADGVLHPDADKACLGMSFPGTGVYYKSNEGFKGVDSFAYDLTLGNQKPVIYGVDAKVTVK